MSRRPEYDLAIVGASIAGTTAATLLARRGLTVALIEREGQLDAYKRACTHFIQPSATPTIERLGLTSQIEAAGAIRNGLEVWTRWGWMVPLEHPPEGYPGHGYSLRRERLDPILRRLATATAGVDFLPGLSATELLRSRGRITGVVAADRHGHRREVSARLVVGADGRHSTLATLAGLRTRVRANARFMYWAYYRDLPLASGLRGQLWFREPDIFYAYPNDDGLTLLACCVTKDRLPLFRRDLEGSFARAFRDLPRAPRVASGVRASRILGQVDNPNLSRPVTRPGVALVGDAALASDPAWAVGCGWAFESAEWLVDCTAESLCAGSDADVDRALGAYRRRHRRRLGGHAFVIASYSTGRRFLPHERLFLAASTRDAAVARQVTLFGERLIGVTGLLRSVGRALCAVAGPLPRAPAEPRASMPRA